jgi:prevent-host-death family protein
MKTANVHEAKTNLSQLLNSAAEGDEVIITRRGGKVTQFKLVPIQTGNKPPLFGALKGKIVFSPDYDSADQEIMELFDKSANDQL